jgi:hypothetical protein
MSQSNIEGRIPKVPKKKRKSERGTKSNLRYNDDSKTGVSNLILQSQTSKLRKVVTIADKRTMN